MKELFKAIVQMKQHGILDYHEYLPSVYRTMSAS